MNPLTSPLTQDRRPSFQPKIASLYEALFQEDDPSPPQLASEGFWTEFFLLRPHAPSLRSLLDPLSSDDLLHLHLVTRTLFRKSVEVLQERKAPQDETALETLQVFLWSVLGKKYTNASSEVIAVLTGLDEVDEVMEKFIEALEGLIRAGRTVEVRRKAIQVALCVACGAFNTGLLSYFTHRDLFPALMKYINDPAATDLTFEPFLTLTVLSNYNKFEFQNPYQLRLDDFVNEGAIKRIVHEIGMTCIKCRSDYVAVMDDLPEEWSFGSVLSMVGLSIFAGAEKKQPTAEAAVQNAEIAKAGFGVLPNARAAILLATYDWVNANMLFCHNFVNYQNPDAKVESPICAYLSLTSYILHHAHKSTRCGLYARTNLFVLRILLEDNGICKRLTSDETKGIVRLCRQKPPHLPLIRGKRLLMTAIIDLIANGINHNLKKKLDVDLYIASLAILNRAITFLIRTRTRLDYHWSELWRSLINFLRFLTNYATDLQQLPATSLTTLVSSLLGLTVLSLTSGDAFLANAAEYDDLFYKLVEAGDALQKFRDAWSGLLSSPSSGISGPRSNGGTPVPGGSSTASAGKSLDVLIKVSEHYWRLIEENRGKKGGGTLSPDLVKEVIKTGYETLELAGGDVEGAMEGLGEGEKWRESEERAVLKRIARMCVDDLGIVLQEEAS